VTAYDELVARLSTVSDGYAAERAGIDAWYDSLCAAARENVAKADERLAAAEAALSTAGTAVEITDTEAARLWGLLATRMKVPRSSLGPVPDVDAAPGGDDREHPGRLLDRVRELLDEVTPAPRRRPVLRALLALTVLAAVLAGVLTVALLLRR
jgi:hypothetical protein